jgi:hypothetical protein
MGSARFGDGRLLPRAALATVPSAIVRAIALLLSPAVLLLPTTAGARTESPPIVLATHDPALLSALSAAFLPRGVAVVQTERPFHRATDDVGAKAGEANVVWLCETEEAAGRDPRRPRETTTALCVRPRRGQVIVRRLSMSTPLSAEDAAALALSVEVVLMPGGADDRRAAPPPTPAAQIERAPTLPPARALPPAGHALTVEVGAGARNAPSGSALRASLAAVYAPGLLGHHLGLGLATVAGPAYGGPTPPARGPGPAPGAGSASDITLRLFARGQLRLAPVWIQLDLGPALHIVTRNSDDSAPDPITERRLHLSTDAFIGAVIPFGRFYAGARAGLSYLVSGRLADTNPAGATWSGEGLLTFGAGFR